MSDFEKKMDDYKELMKSLLSKKRFTHCLNVADMCKKLAQINNFDTEKAYMAGLLHDIKKEETPEAMKSMAILSNMNVSDIEEQTPALWHALASAYYVRKTLKITDEDVLNAIRYHTVGRAEMSTLEKIVYLGDLTSIDRSYKDVEKYRKMSLADLDNGMYNAVKWSIEETMGKGGLIPACTFEGYNFYTTIEKSKAKG